MSGKSLLDLPDDHPSFDASLVQPCVEFDNIPCQLPTIHQPPVKKTPAAGNGQGGAPTPVSSSDSDTNSDTTSSSDDEERILSKTPTEKPKTQQHVKPRGIETPESVDLQVSAYLESVKAELSTEGATISEARKQEDEPKDEKERRGFGEE